MLHRKRLTALLLCAGMLLALLLSSAYIALEADHSCAGEACEICERIAQTEALLQGLALLGAILPAWFGLPAVFCASRAKEARQSLATPTPVRWKVRLND